MKAVLFLKSKRAIPLYIVGSALSLIAFQNCSGVKFAAPGNGFVSVAPSAQGPSPINLPSTTTSLITPVVDVTPVNGKDFQLTSNNNLLNGRGTWTTRVYGADPGQNVYVSLISYKVDGVEQQDVSHTENSVGMTAADGQLIWSGQQGCPEYSLCQHTWQIRVSGYSVIKQFMTTMVPINSNNAPNFPPPAPITDKYTNWMVTTTNNQANGRGTWTTRVYNAEPNRAVYVHLVSYKIDGVAQPINSAESYVSMTGTDGQLVWSGQQGCPDNSTCIHSWGVRVDGTTLQEGFVTTMLPVNAPVTSTTIPPAPTTTQYDNWQVVSTNNLANGRGTWTTRVFGAAPIRAVYYRLLSYKIDGVLQPVDTSEGLVGLTGTDGTLVWGGQTGCPTGSSCEHLWQIRVDGTTPVRQYTTEMTP